MQHADGTTDSDKAANANDSNADGSEGEEGAEEDKVGGYLRKAQNLINQAKNLSQDTASETSEWVTDAVGNAGDAAAGIGESISDTYESLRDRGMTTAKDARQWVQDDVRNMNAFEYKVVPKSQISGENMEAILNELGEERWDCFEVDDTTFYFKRQKKSYLRNIPVKDLLRFLPMGGGDE